MQNLRVQAVSPKEQSRLSEAESKELRRNIHLLIGGRSADMPDAAKYLRDNATSADIARFLTQEWQAEETRQRKREQSFRGLRTVLSWLCALWFAAVVSILCWSKITGTAIDRFGMTPFPPLILLVLVLKMKPSVGRLSQGYTELLIVYGNERHLGAFVDSLRHPYLRDSVKERLTDLLLQGHVGDAPPLDDHQVNALAQELKRGIDVLYKNDAKAISAIDVAFWKSIIAYFADEVRAGKPVPKEIETTLSHFVAQIPRNGSLNTAWGSLQSVYEECLVCLKQR